MPFNIGPLELIIVLIIALLVVGPRRLPEMGSALGRTIREFRNASSDVRDATSAGTTAEAPPPNRLRDEAAPNTTSDRPPSAGPVSDRTSDDT